MSPDGLVYTFTLRDGLKWHDGGAVTPADCIASLKRWMTRDTGGQLIAAAMTGMEAAGDRSFAITFAAPFPAMLEIIGKPTANVPFIMPERVAGTPADTAITDYTGSGPFKVIVDEFRPGVRIVYEKFEDYVPAPGVPSAFAGAKNVLLDRVEWVVMPDPQALVTTVLVVVIAVPLGVLAAWRQNSWIDHVIMTLSVLGFSVPAFMIGYVLIKIFAMDLRLLPVQGYRAPTVDPMGFLQRIVLPAITLAAIYIALIARMTRASLLNILQEDYIRTARAKGIAERKVLFRHALRNAAVPILTVIGTGFALLISGVVITETVYNIPGLGRLTVDAVFSRDYPTIQALILLTAGVYVGINLLIDLCYVFLDPRIRY